MPHRIKKLYIKNVLKFIKTLDSQNLDQGIKKIIDFVYHEISYAYTEFIKYFGLC
jgi:hypothetical protein